MTLPEGLTINPDAADGQTACTDAEANFGTDGAGQLPGQLEDRDRRSRHAGARRAADRLALHRRTAARATSTGCSWSSTASASTRKLVADVHPDPQTGQLTVSVDDLPQVPFEEFDLHLFASDRGLMATPTQCTLYTPKSISSPGTTARRRRLDPVRQRSPGPNGRPCPGQVRPFHPRLVAGYLEPRRRRLQRLHAETRPRRRRPVPRRPQLQDAAGLHRRPPRASPTAPSARSRPRRRTPGRAEQASPSCPAVEPDRDHQRRRRPGLSPVPRGRQDVPGGPVQGRAAEPGRDHAGPRRPL